MAEGRGAGTSISERHAGRMFWRYPRRGCLPSWPLDGVPCFYGKVWEPQVSSPPGFCQFRAEKIDPLDARSARLMQPGGHAANGAGFEAGVDIIRPPPPLVPPLVASKGWLKRQMGHRRSRSRGVQPAFLAGCLALLHHGGEDLAIGVICGLVRDRPLGLALRGMWTNAQLGGAYFHRQWGCFFLFFLHVECGALGMVGRGRGDEVFHVLVRIKLGMRGVGSFASPVLGSHASGTRLY